VVVLHNAQDGHGGQSSAGTRVSGDLYNMGSYRSGIPESMTTTIFLGLLQRMRYIAGLTLNVFLVLRRVC
jgi:hypothetical protein